MNILVCIKQVPGTSNVEVDEKTGVLKREGIDSKMNPFDLFALETAIRIKENNNAKVTVLTMGPPQSKDIIKEAFMMGADHGVILSDKKFAGSDVLATAYTLSQGIRKIGIPDIIICGKQTTDGDTAQAGPEIAEFLNIPHAAYVSEIKKLNTDSIELEMDMDNTLETVKINFPCLITVDNTITQPRLPSFRLKLATQDRKITTYTLIDFSDSNEEQYGLDGSPTQVIKIFPPTPNTDHEIWNGTGEELANRLTDKLKELKFIS